MNKPRKSDKVTKYATALIEGKTKKEAKEIAGYSPNTQPARIEETSGFKKVTVKSAILEHITLKEITEKHVELIKQDEDKGIRLSAVKLAYERIEPEIDGKDDSEEIVVTLR